jgi:type IV pilus assembly protein PilN
VIKINLLGEGRRPVAARQRRASSKRIETAPLLMMILGALGLLGALGYFFVLGQALERKEAEVAEAQKEVDELAAIIREVEEFKTKKAELERKVQIVYDLKANQLGPVRIMDYISKALPQLMWLTNMDVQGASISIRGEAFNTNAVANFMESLDEYPEFSEPVLRDTQQRGEVYTFAIEVGYSFRDRVVSAAEEMTTAASGG